MKRQTQTKLFDSVLIKEAIKASFVKLNPRILIHNPVMFTRRGRYSPICSLYVSGIAG